MRQIGAPSHRRCAPSVPWPVRQDAVFSMRFREPRFRGNDRRNDRMTEHTIVAATGEPRTQHSLMRDLRLLGVMPGETLLVHCAMSALGWVAGGAEAVVRALLDAVTDAGD